MANINRENIGVLTEKLTVELSKDDYLPAFENSLKKYAKKATLPGFRKGMVPPGLIKKMYGSGLFTEEILHVVEDQLKTYFSGEKLEIFGQPLPLPNNERMLDMNNPTDYAFAFEIGLKPSFNIDISQVNVTRYKVEVTDEMINEEIERLAKSYGNVNEKDSIHDENDLLNLEMKESDENGEEIENGKTTEITVALKDFEEATRNDLKDKKADYTLVAQPSKIFLQNEGAEMEKLGLSAEDHDKFFKLKIIKVSVLHRAEINEDFFEKVYPEQNITTEEAFREAIKKDIGYFFDAQATNNLHDQIFHYLIDNTDMQFPDDFLKKWMQAIEENPKSEEDLEKEYPSFVNNLKWSLISEKLSNENNVKVSSEEIRQAAKQQLSRYMRQDVGEAPWIDDYINRMMKDEKFLQKTYSEIEMNKLLSFIETKAQISEEAIGAKEFEEKIHHHHHH